MEFVSFSHVVLDGSLSPAASRFWARALDARWQPATPGAPGVESLVPATGDAYVHRAAPGVDGPAVVLEVADVAVAVARVGALLGSPTDDPAALRSPGGLPFALVEARPRRRPPAARWPDGTASRLVQLCLDCPPDAAGVEAAFWRDLTGWRWEDSRSPEFVCHLVPRSGSLQLLVQRRDSALPREVTLHLDLGASDREAETRRLEALGGHRLATGPGWVVLADPDGRRLCATGQPPEAP